MTASVLASGHRPVATYQWPFPVYVAPRPWASGEALLLPHRCHILRAGAHQQMLFVLDFGWRSASGQKFLKVRGRAGAPCLVCGTTIRRILPPP